ncbi:allantoate permease [Suillus discolor]|uniref:Allantoate permease n=1 Tax=Suillus discolor TaxID=1912936 RepID=A0A9P7F3R6_9AGAM|nr:allantoate permease [Suillus discolor]KAG2104391.1 allantoate permease [Suillus discolor]
MTSSVTSLSMTNSVSSATPEQQTPMTDGLRRSVSLLSSVEKRSSSLPTDDLVDEAEEQFSWTTAIFRRKQIVHPDPDATATKRSVFDEPDLAPHYWPNKDYENLHRFDPAARWTYKEEKALVRKLDWKIMITAAIGFAALNLDRNNLSQANSDSFLQDLGLTTDDFNLGNTVFRLAFLCAELPSQLVSKRIGPDRWIPTQMCLWSFVSLSQFWLTGRTSFLVCRALLGFFPPRLTLLTFRTDFYTKTELPVRLALFWMTMNFCAIIASFIAYGTLHMDGVAGAAGWQWLFMIEGILTLFIGILSFFRMPASPTQTKTWFRPNGWFTEREEIIMVNRVLRDDPTKGDMHNREGLTLRRLWTAMCDYDLWPIYILGLMFGIPNTPPSTYLTLLLRDIGFDTFNTNLLTIPSQAFGIITMFVTTLVSEFVNERSIVSMMEDLWTLPFLVALYALPSSPNPWVFFAVVTAKYLSLVQVGWCSRNAGAVASRTVNASLYNMFVQASEIISAQIYVASDAPRYRHGNEILIVICCINICILYPGTKAYYMWRNRQRAKIWDAMTTEERAHYLSTTKDVGNRRLDFRFAH